MCGGILYNTLKCNKNLTVSIIIVQTQTFVLVLILHVAGNIGGQLGLFIGCSFLTAIEFLECLFMSTIYHCKRSGRKRNQKRKEWTANPDDPSSNGDKTMPAYGFPAEANRNHHNNNGCYDVANEQQPRVRSFQT